MTGFSMTQSTETRTVRARSMKDNSSILVRYATLLLLPIAFLVVPAAPGLADYQAGMDAYNRRDFSKALREWQPLAERGDASAQFSLGLLYENGDGVPRDYAKAREWYEKAAAQGEARAQFYLGMQSAFGQGGQVDLVQAYMWYSLAAGNGNMHAPGYRDDLTRQMTPAQITEGRKRVQEWKQKGK